VTFTPCQAYGQHSDSPTNAVSTGFIRDMLLDEDKDRLNDRQIANNAAHGFGAAM
jgi:hypothetical protein